MKLRATLAAGVLAASSVAFGVTGLGTVDTGAATTVDHHKLGMTGEGVDTEPIGNVRDGADVAMVNQTDNLELLHTVETGRASDIQFQRREGTQVLDGEQIDAVKDYAFVGTINGDDGFAVVDVTDPTDPALLAKVRCGGFHNDITVWENYVVLGHDGGAVACDGQEDIGAIGGPGIWVFDVTDPARPVLVRHVGSSQFNPTDKIHRGTHNISVNPESGQVVFSFQALGDITPRWGYLDLTGDVTTNVPVVRSMRDMGFVTADGCHDQGFAHGFTDVTGAERDLLFCAAIGSTLIWDITADPTDPQLVANIVNPDISIHHGARLAPDGRTLVINDELAGATPVNCSAGAPTGTQFAYDISVPENPVPLGYGSSEDLPATELQTCTSHFYNFIAAEDMADERQLVVTGWYVSGLVVHDFTRVAGLAPIGRAPTYAQSTPEGVSLWSAYAYRGYLYGASFGSGNSGLFIYALDGYTPTDGAEAPGVNPWDEGTSWGRWTQNDA